MQIVIIDDEYPSRNELRFMIEQYRPSAIIDEADSGQSAIALLEKKRYDAAFVDVHLGDVTGTALAPLLRNKQPDLKIVFATAYDDYAVQAFDIEATDYIMKPFDPRRVETCLHRLLSERHDSSSMPGKLTVQLDKKTVVLDIAEIAFIESQGRFCIVHADGESYRSIQPLGQFVKKLSPNHFFRAHKSYLINLDYITELTPWVNGAMSVMLRGYPDASIPVSRNQVKSLKELFSI